MSEDSAAALARATDLWRRAQVVHEGPARREYPEALEVVFRIARDHPECHDGLVGLLASDSQLVVAYSLLTLQAMQSGVLENLPQELLERRDNITIVAGSVKNSMDLGGLARQVQKRARQRHQKATD